ncbi:MAG: response regulator transcription factor [Anaerolineae bacterium]|nr:response regulator transcription factor [Anaerolineae bacterium]
MPDFEGKCILVIDDEPELLLLVRTILTHEGFQVLMADCGQEGLRTIQTHQPDLILLDIMMPGLAGWDVCTHVLQSFNIPIIFLTALTGDDEIVQGLNLGAVDYIAKPFSSKILVARVRAALRNADHDIQNNAFTVYADDHLYIDLEQHRIKVNQNLMDITGTEFLLLSYLLNHANQVVTFSEILCHVWGAEYQGTNNYVHVYIWRLRQKIEKDPKRPRYLLSVPGIGYRFEISRTA